MQHPLIPHGPPVPEFFGRRYLRAAELFEIGIVQDRKTLNALVARGVFPPPIKLDTQTVVWDAVEVAAVLQQCAAERAQGEAT
jgi:predicted DNA-binding transcriptional regulator AlpA